MRGRDAIVMAGVAVLAAVLVQAGPLSPPGGGVAPTYKTLGEIDPGTPLSSVPAGQGAQHLITQPGRYYLTGNMVGVSGLWGVMVMVPDVTIDLRGFALQGVTGSLGAVIDGVNVARVTIQNGSIAGWNGYAVRAPLGVDWVCRDLLVQAVNDGVYLGYRALVEGCTVSGSGETGISTGTDSRVARCAIGQCLMGGLTVGDGTRVESCTFGDNSQEALMGGVGVTVVDCTVSHTHMFNGSGDGIVLSKNGIVERCVVQGNDGLGVYSDQGGTIVRGCKIDSNKGDGINVFNSSLVVDNEVHANGSIVGGAATTAGIRVRGTATRVDGNHLVSNNTAVVIVGTGNLVVRNSFSANGAHVAGGAGNSVAQIIQAPANGFVSTDPWANFNY